MSINFTSHFYEIFNISIYLQNNMYISDNATHKLYHINTSYTIYKLTNQLSLKLTQPYPGLLKYHLGKPRRRVSSKYCISDHFSFQCGTLDLFTSVHHCTSFTSPCCPENFPEKRRFLINHPKQHFPDKRKGDEERFL